MRGGDKSLSSGSKGDRVKEVDQEMKPQGRNRGIAKAAILVAFVLVAVYVVRFTPMKEYLTAETLGTLLDKAGV